VADLFIDLGRKQVVTPAVLRTAMAKLLADMDDPKVDKKTAKMLGRGKPHEKRFALIATRGTKDKKVLKKIARGLTDKDPSVVVLTLEILGEAQYEDGVKAMEKILDKGKTELVLTAAMKALSQIRGGDDEWRARLEGFARGEHRLLRNASIRALGEGRKLLDLFTDALEHPDWSTRLATLNALELVRTAPVVGIIVERMSQEDGRMLRECAASLWRLTGEPHGLRIAAWKGWYGANKDSIEIISSAKLARLEEEEETRRLKETSRVEFFGIRIESKSVIFVLDISGSMLEQLRSHYVGKKGEPRIDRAKSELIKAIESLEEGALFNVVAFNGGVLPWKESLSAATGSTRAECGEWINKLGALGGTNLFDSLELAFQDADVDTIMILSDGEPTAGRMTEPSGIRREVLDWNNDRNIRIHTVAMGGSLKILEWLAEDSDGEHARHD
jgi:HEAT repeat protein